MDEGRVKISSKELSERMRLTASQIRQDLNCFGGFGQQGYGYNVEVLRHEIAMIIGTENIDMNRVIIIGAGNIGTAICDNLSFEKRGCVLVGIFDKSERLHGKMTAGHKIRGMHELSEFCERKQPRIAVLCIPKAEAKSVCEELIALNVRNFWNFSHFDINLYFDNVNVENVHLGDSLLTLVYNVNCGSKRLAVTQ